MRTRLHKYTSETECVFTHTHTQIGSYAYAHPKHLAPSHTLTYTCAHTNAHTHTESTLSEWTWQDRKAAGKAPPTVRDGFEYSVSKVSAETQHSVAALSSGKHLLFFPAHLGHSRGRNKSGIAKEKHLPRKQHMGQKRLRWKEFSSRVVPSRIVKPHTVSGCCCSSNVTSKPSKLAGSSTRGHWRWE